MANKNSNLSKAKSAKNDEFYTQYHDIEKEMQAYLDFDENVFRGKTVLLPCDDPEWSNFTKYFAQNFSRLGLKKLISTSFAHQSKQLNTPYQPSLFESESALFDQQKSTAQGKIFTLTQDINLDGEINLQDLQWQYLTSDGDFRSDEIKKLRDEADIIITNPPFSLFREFMAWIMEGKKQFAVIGNMNAITYKEIFPLIKENKIWLGKGFTRSCAHFFSPNESNSEYLELDRFEKMGISVPKGLFVTRVASIHWFTNIEHGRRHQPLQLMTMADNLKFNKQIMNDPNAYQPYDNYDAIEIPKTNGIPSDYEGVMGVPISFLDKYCPEQFEIVWQASGNTRASAPKSILADLDYQVHSEDRGGCTVINNKRTYGRILIKHKNPTK